MREAFILKRLAGPIGQLLVDHKGFPPSNRGVVKHMLRKGYVKKIREPGGWGNSRYSVLIITPEGRERLNRIKQ